jgi:glycosyltransferase involved in cell wall biosynthesis
LYNGPSSALILIMKIAHLTTTLEGGAANAVIRINKSLNNFGVHSEIFSRTIPQRPLHPTENILGLNSLQKFQSSAVTLLQSMIVQKNAELMTPVSLDYFRDHMGRMSHFDVIHLHSTYNFVSKESFSLFTSINKPVFITLHDQRFLTGGCHYSGLCNEYEKACLQCPKVREVFRPLVRNAFKNESRILDSLNFTLISPSQWLKDVVSKSSKVRDIETYVIKNPIPENFFSPQKIMNNKSDKFQVKKTIGFISANLNNPYKGLSILFQALQALVINTPENRFELLLVGDGEIPNAAGLFEIRRVICKSDEEMVTAIQEIDVLVVPSLEDNSPSVIGEAVAAGIPVIGSRVGGITELLEEMGLPLFQVGDVVGLGKILLSFLEGKSEYPEKEIQDKAVEIFSSARYAKKQIEVYEKML